MRRTKLAILVDRNWLLHTFQLPMRTGRLIVNSQITTTPPVTLAPAQPQVDPKKAPTKS